MDHSSVTRKDAIRLLTEDASGAIPAIYPPRQEGASSSSASCMAPTLLISESFKSAKTVKVTSSEDVAAGIMAASSSSFSSFYA